MSRICKHKYCHCLEVLCTMRSIICRRCLKNTFWISYVFWVFTQQRLSNLKCFPFSQKVKVKGTSILILFCEKGHNRLLKFVFLLPILRKFCDWIIGPLKIIISKIYTYTTIRFFFCNFKSNCVHCYLYTYLLGSTLTYLLNLYLSMLCSYCTIYLDLTLHNLLLQKLFWPLGSSLHLWFHLTHLREI